MDKYMTVLVSLAVLTFVLIVGADEMYAKHRADGKRFSSQVQVVT